VNAPTAIIAEDEPLLRAEIRRSLLDLWPTLQISAEVGDGIQALEAVRRCAPNVLFLDIQMPGLNGIEVARQASGLAHVVFITAYDAYALEAFEQGALDYILKPVDTARLKLTIDRVKARLRDPPADLSGLVDLLRTASPSEPQYMKWLTVPQGEQLRVVAVAEILFLRADNKYTTLATRSGTYLLNSSLRELQGKLDPGMFWQIHRGTVVNVSAIDTIYRSFRGSLEVKLKDRSELLPVSASHAHLFRHH
jgi:DNA-binding LytR/AlgR family response regulator